MSNAQILEHLKDLKRRETEQKEYIIEQLRLQAETLQRYAQELEEGTRRNLIPRYIDRCWSEDASQLDACQGQIRALEWAVKAIEEETER